MIQYGIPRTHFMNSTATRLHAHHSTFTWWLVSFLASFFPVHGAVDHPEALAQSMEPSALRLEVQLQANFVTGLLEWRVR
jgi:hypothetical protein